MAEKLPPGVEERVKRIMQVCENDLDVFVDNLNVALMHVVLKREPLTDWQREALKKSLTAYVDCVDTVEQEFR